MASRLNSDSSNGLQLISDSSGELQFQSSGITKATLNSSGLSSPGHVIQVVYNSDNTNAITSTGGTTITAVSASITPSSTSSKILIIARLATRYIKQGSNIAGWASPKIYRGDSTVISPAPGQNYEQGINFGDANWGDFRLIATIQSLDSPNTTSSITYSARMTLYDAQASVQVNESGVYHSTITLMEVAG